MTKTFRSAHPGSRVTRSERWQHLPGDDLVPAPRWSYHRAVSIAAPRTAVWQRLLQLVPSQDGLVAVFKPERALVLRRPAGRAGGGVTRAFYLYGLPDGSTRVLERGRGAERRGLLAIAAGRRTLQQIKGLVETVPADRAARASQRDEHRQRRLRQAAWNHGIRD